MSILAFKPFHICACGKNSNFAAFNTWYIQAVVKCYLWMFVSHLYSGYVEIRTEHVSFHVCG